MEEILRRLAIRIGELETNLVIVQVENEQFKKRIKELEDKELEEKE